MKRLVACAWALLLVQLLLPATSLAAPTAVGPASASPLLSSQPWHVDWPETGRSLSFEPTAAGWSVQDLATGERQPIGLTADELDIVWIDRNDERFVAAVTVEALPGAPQLTLAGELDAARGEARVTLFDRDGRVLAEELRIEPPAGAGLDLVVLIPIAVGVAAICGLAALAQDCGSECRQACGSAGVAYFSEGLCGTCDCGCAGS